MFYFLLSTVSLWANSGVYVLRVVDIIDGDTVAAIDATGSKQTIKLMGLDAPEKGQPFWKESKQALKNGTLKKNITFSMCPVNKDDVLLAYLTDDKGMNINKTLVEYGYAWNCSTEQEYCDASDLAKKNKRGLWKSSKPIAPWDYREAVALKKTSKTTEKRNSRTRKTCI